MGDGAVRPRLERVREGVPEIEQLAHPAVVRVPEAERRLVGGAAADELVVRQLPQRLAGEETGLDHLGQPLASVFLGQGREVVGVDDGADRPVEGADEVLALAQVDRRLAADRGVHLADQRRGHGDPVDASEVGRCDETADVGRAAAAEGHERAASVEPEVAPETLGGRDRLRLLSGGHRQHRGVDRRRVQREHAFVRDELHRARSGDQAPCHGRNGHGARGEDDAVGVGRARVGDLGVERLPPFVTASKLGLVLRKGAAASVHARPSGVDVDVEVDLEGIEARKQVMGLDRAAADSDHARLAASCRLAQKAGLQLSEGGLAALLEELPDRPFGPLDLVVDVEERPPEPVGHLGADRRLAGAHEADQHDVPP